MLRKYPKIFQNPHINYPIYDLNLSFTDYIKQSEKIIADHRQDLNLHPELTIQNNAPFELKPNELKPKTGVLLIHGLLDSPFIMRDIGNYLQSEGLLVRSIMLPGHSTVPGALLDTSLTQWQQAVTYGVHTLKQDVENIILVGFSTGANLAISHALKDPSIAGLMLIAPAFKINSPFAFLAQWMSNLKKWNRARWFSLEEEIDYLKYQSITFNAINQVYHLGLDIQKPINCPIFMVLSQEDKIVCSRTSMQNFQQTKNKLNRTVLYSAKPQSFSDQRILVRNSVYPDKNIFSFCHISLPVAPDNFHYGENGDYVLASHLDKNTKYGALDKLDISFYNFLRRINLTSFHYERLTFNPDFEFMRNQMGNFIKSLS